MIPSILPEAGTPSGKSTPAKESIDEAADGRLFGDLVAVPDEVPVAVKGRSIASDLKVEPKLEDAEILLSEKEVAAKQPAGDADQSEAAFGRAISDGTLEEPLSTKTKADLASVTNVPRSGTPTEVVAARKTETPQVAIATSSEGQKSVAPSDRPSVAQTVIEGRLPQQASAENTEKKSRAGAVERPESFSKALSTTVSASQGVPEKDQSAKGVSAEFKPTQSPSVDKREHRKDMLRETSAKTVQKGEIPKLTQGPPPAVALAQTATQNLPEKIEKANKVTVSDIAIGTVQADRLSQTQTAQAIPTSSPTPETARQVASQIAMAVTNTTGKTTEISLNPEELGRVRLSLSATEGSITLNVLAERVETQDLLRRHMDQLAQEFRALGYNSITFSFGDQSGTPHAQPPQTEDNTEPDVQDIVSTTDIAPERITVGLDLRV